MLSWYKPLGHMAWLRFFQIFFSEFFFRIFFRSSLDFFSDFRQIIGDYRNLSERNEIIGLPIIIGELESLIYMNQCLFILSEL